MNCIPRGLNLKLRLEKFKIKTESVETSNSVSETHSYDLTEKSKTSVLTQSEDHFFGIWGFRMEKTQWPGLVARTKLFTKVILY